MEKNPSSSISLMLSADNIQTRNKSRLQAPLRHAYMGGTALFFQREVRMSRPKASAKIVGGCSG